MLGFPYVFHIPIDELSNKLRFLALSPYTPPLGRRAIPLLGFVYVFGIPIHELTKNLRFLAIAALHPP